MKPLTIAICCQYCQLCQNLNLSIRYNCYVCNHIHFYIQEEYVLTVSLQIYIVQWSNTTENYINKHLNQHLPNSVDPTPAL